MGAATQRDLQPQRRVRIRSRTWILAGIAVAICVLAAILYFEGRHDDLHVPPSAMPLVSGARIADTFEEPPIAHPFSYSRWIVAEGPPVGSSRDLAFRQRYQLIYDDWRDVTPPRASGTYAALSPDREFRLVYLTTGEDALKRSKQLSVPGRVRRRLGRAKRPTVVVLIDRNVTFPVGTG